MFIPVLLYAGSLFYSSRIAGLLATVLFGGITLEGRMSSFELEEKRKENERNYTLGLNPLYERHLLEERRSKLKMIGLPEANIEKLIQSNPPGVGYVSFELIEKDLPPSQRHLAGKWLLTEQEDAQFSDMLRSNNLDLGVNEGAKFYELCRTHGIDPHEMELLTWPASNMINVNVGWLMRVSKARLSDQEFMRNLRGEEAKS